MEGSKWKTRFRTQCSPERFLKEISELTPRQKHLVEDMGFGGLLKLRCEKLHRKLLLDIVRNVDPNFKRFKCGGEEHAITPEAVELVLGIPSKGRSVPTGVGSLKRPMPDISTGLKERFKDMDDDELKRTFLIFACATMLAPNSKPGGAVKLNNAIELNEIGEYNWGEFVVSRLMDGIKNFQKKCSTKKREDGLSLNGSCIFLQLMFISCFHCGDDPTPVADITFETVERRYKIMLDNGMSLGEVKTIDDVGKPLTVLVKGDEGIKHVVAQPNFNESSVRGLLKKRKRGIETTTSQKKVMQRKSTAKYEKEIQQLSAQCQSLVSQCEDLKVKYTEEHAKRRKLHNQLQEAKGNIRVFCRCRPLNETEVASGHAMAVDFDAAKDGDIGILTGGSTKKNFKFDRVYTPKDDQVEVFADASPMVISVLDGYNVCIFAYGQTGTGKTFTMEGNESNRGVNYRTLEELFRVSKERSEAFMYDISVSMLEVYNEQIRDLLCTSPTSKKLEIKQASEGFHHVLGIVEAKVESTAEVWNVLQAGSSARAIGSNNVNEHSSRSHCMLCIMVKAKNIMSGECTNSKLWLVDLAGRERLAKTDAQGARLKEAQNINRSLSALGDVISALAAKNNHIPYRNSKLTHLLQDSLGGDSKTLMFVQISPSEQDLSETLNSLNFATRVRGVELGRAKKQTDTSELQRLRLMLDKARQENRTKDESLKKLEASLQNFESKAKGKDQFHNNQQEKIKELESQLELKTSVHNQSEKQVLHLSERLKGNDEICACLQQKVQELEKNLKEKKQLESTTCQQVKDLENKLKEQVKESESLRHKIEELERKLKERDEHNSEPSLHQKVIPLP